MRVAALVENNDDSEVSGWAPCTWSQVGWTNAVTLLRTEDDVVGGSGTHLRRPLLHVIDPAT